MRCADTIEHSLHKVLLHVYHVLRFKSQNLRASEVMKESAGDTLLITMDYVMKHEETQARESSREHHDKRGIVVHGAFAKYKDDNNNV